MMPKLRGLSGSQENPAMPCLSWQSWGNFRKSSGVRYQAVPSASKGVSIMMSMASICILLGAEAHRFGLGRLGGAGVDLDLAHVLDGLLHELELLGVLVL